MNNIILYTTHCPKCNILKAKLDEKNISYTEITDINLMRAKKILMAPVLEINGEILDFKPAVDWVNQQ